MQDPSRQCSVQISDSEVFRILLRQHWGPKSGKKGAITISCQRLENLESHSPILTPCPTYGRELDFDLFLRKTNETEKSGTSRGRSLYNLHVRLYAYLSCSNRLGDGRTGLFGNLIVKPALIQNRHLGTSIKKRDEGIGSGHCERKQWKGSHRCTVVFRFSW